MGNTVELIKKYMQPIYVETGCSAGDGLGRAIEAGVGTLFGIEPFDQTMGRCKKEYGPVAHLFEGTSERFMNDVVLKVDACKERAIFFLDAHFEGPSDKSPLPYEFSTIFKAKRKDHIIMVDDVRLFGNEIPVTLHGVLGMIDRINSMYKICYEDSNTHKEDVLVAYL
jgi:hypothetical protein